MLHEEDLSARAGGRIWQPLSTAACIDAHHASWYQIGKGKEVFGAELGIQKCFSAEGAQRPCASRRPGAQKVSQGRDLWNAFGGQLFQKPRNPCILIVHRGIQNNRALPQQKRLQPWDVVQMKPKNREPVAQSVIRYPAESYKLMNAWRS